MVNCVSCGTANIDNARFCTNCGYDLEVAPAAATTTSSGASNACLWCKKQAGFTEEEGKMDSKWGATAHRMKIFLCNNCGYAHLFGLGRTIWDFD